MTTLRFRSVLLLLVPALVWWAQSPSALGIQDPPAREAQATKPATQTATKPEKPMLVQYLEVVTAEVDATCSTLESLHGVRFGEPEAALGNARTAMLAGGGWVGVRAPLRADEEPVVRPYVLVGNIAAAVKAAEAGGGEIALPATEIPGRGKFAIYFQGGIEYGLWEL
jgi:predicted enzyme related to lactoylglutathione lyase